MPRGSSFCILLYHIIQRRTHLSLVTYLLLSGEKVKFEFLDRWKRKAWSDKEDRDDIAFWEQQKKEYLQLNPTHHQMIAEFEAEVDTAEDVYMEDVV